MNYFYIKSLLAPCVLLAMSFAATSQQATLLTPDSRRNSVHRTQPPASARPVHRTQPRAILSNLRRIPAQPQDVLVFNDLESYPDNNLGAMHGSFENGGASVSLQALQGFEAFCHAGKSLSLSYDVTPENSFSGYVSPFLSEDLTGYRYLSFRVKGAAGGEYFSIELKRENGQSAKVFLWNYLPCGPTLEWQKVVIPLDAFWNLTALSEMYEFVIVFDHYSSNANSSPLVGEVHIDDIVFGSYFTGMTKIDPFGDKINNNAAGGNNGMFSHMGTDDNYTSEIICPVSSDPNCHCLYKINYDNSMEDDFGGAFFILGGGTTGWDGVGKRLPMYDAVYLEVMAEAPASNPGNFKVELKSNIIHSFKLEGITTENQSFSIPFADFSPPVINHAVEGFNIVFEEGVQDHDSGAVFLDEIELRAEDYLGPDTTKPAAPENLLVNGASPGEVTELAINQTASVSANIGNSNQRLESVRLEYSDGCDWYCLDRKYAPFNVARVDFEIAANGLPENTFLRMRAVAENYNGISCPGDAFIVAVNAPFMHITTASSSICLGETVLFEAEAGNLIHNFSYDWMIDGQRQNTGADSLAATFPGEGSFVVQGLLTVYGDCGMETTVRSNAVEVAVHPYPSIEANNNSPLCEGDSVQLMANGGATYLWSGPMGFSSAGQNPLAGHPGNYSVLIANEFGCQAATSTEVLPFLLPPAAMASGGTITCSNPTVLLDASSSVSGSGGGLLFSWSGPGTVSDPDSAVAAVDVPGVFIVTVTDSNNGCRDTALTVAAENTALPTADAGPAAVLNCANPTALLDAGGSSGMDALSFLWEGPGISSGQNTPTPMVNLPGTYSVTVTEIRNGCTATDSTTVTEDTAEPDITASGGIIYCPETGTQLMGYSSVEDATYAWQGPGGFSSAQPNPTVYATGTYRLTVTAPNGCSSTAEVEVTAAPPLFVSISFVEPSCHDNADGSATAMPSDGLPPYSYAWSNGATGSAVSNLSGGTYTVTVTDQSGCENIVSVAIEAPDALILDSLFVSDTCDCGLQVTVEGGTPPYAYAWLDSESNTVSHEESPCNLDMANTYQVLVTDLNGCMALSEEISCVTVSLPLEDDGLHISCYPNPVSHHLTVEASFGRFRHLRFKIISLDGQTTDSYHFQGAYILQNIDVSHLPNGIYFLEFNVDGKRLIKKLARIGNE